MHRAAGMLVAFTGAGALALAALDRGSLDLPAWLGAIGVLLGFALLCGSKLGLLGAPPAHSGS